MTPDFSQVAVITAIAFFKGWQKFRASEINGQPVLKDVPIFSIVEATTTPAMPEGSCLLELRTTCQLVLFGAQVQRIQLSYKRSHLNT